MSTLRQLETIYLTNAHNVAKKHSGQDGQDRVFRRALKRCVGRAAKTAARLSPLLNNQLNQIG